VSTVEWVSVINQAAESGADRVQLIGGEPTLHPGFPILLDRALSRGMEAEIFTNLLRVSPAFWDLDERSWKP
jgi:MoaA/NifB/PqqE/SkfB family radical SAM enzyme